MVDHTEDRSEPLGPGSVAVARGRSSRRCRPRSRSRSRVTGGKDDNDNEGKGGCRIDVVKTSESVANFVIDSNLKTPHAQETKAEAVSTNLSLASVFLLCTIVALSLVLASRLYDGDLSLGSFTSLKSCSSSILAEDLQSLKDNGDAATEVPAEPELVLPKHELVIGNLELVSVDVKCADEGGNVPKVVSRAVSEIISQDSWLEAWDNWARTSAPEWLREAVTLEAFGMKTIPKGEKIDSLGSQQIWFYGKSFSRKSAVDCFAENAEPGLCWFVPKHCNGTATFRMNGINTEATCVRPAHYNLNLTGFSDVDAMPLLFGQPAHREVFYTSVDGETVSVRVKTGESEDVDFEEIDKMPCASGDVTLRIVPEAVPACVRDLVLEWSDDGN